MLLLGDSLIFFDGTAEVIDLSPRTKIWPELTCDLQPFDIIIKPTIKGFQIFLRLIMQLDVKIDPIVNPAT